jgi:hypothetical protein
MTEWAGYAGKSLAVPARASCPRVLPARPARAVVFVRVVMWEGVVVLAVREDRGRSGDGNHFDEGSRWLKHNARNLRGLAGCDVGCLAWWVGVWVVCAGVVMVVV